METYDKRKIGAFYTPKQVTDALSVWAIRGPEDKILEPSFGGCNFLTSSVDALNTLGCSKSLKNIYGFDIDPKAFEILRKKRLQSKNFILGDFLQSTVKTNKILVPIILGNPPFLPIHKLDREYKTTLFKNFKKHVFKIPRRSSLWVYFVIHSLQFLSVGGRMAWVVPDSIAFTGYGKEFLNQLSQQFKGITLVRIEERFFNESGTHEKTSLLLCEGFGQGQCEVNEVSYILLSDALKYISQLKKLQSTHPKSVSDIPGVSNNKWKMTTLGDIFKIRIGIVLGASSLLTLKKKQALVSPYYPNYTYLILTKGKQLSNVLVNSSLLQLVEDSPTYLIDAIRLEKENPALFSDFLKTIPPSTLLNQTFSKRHRLFEYDDFNHPDAFVTYYSQGLPKVIVNESANLNCTNSIHRLYLKDEYKSKAWIKELVAIQTFVDFMGDHTKKLARPYGNDIYKYEPSDIIKIPVVLPSKLTKHFLEKLNSTFVLISEAIQIGKKDVAVTLANSFLASYFPI